jgi:AraC-like DNA-binding protein
VTAAGRYGATPLTVLHTRDKVEAEAAVTAAYLPNRVETREPGSLDVRLAALHLSSATVGRLSYGIETRLRTGDANHYHVNVTLQGRAVSRMGNGAAICTELGQAAVFMPTYPADILWQDGCVQLCVMIRRAAVHAELEQLLDRSVRTPVVFESVMDLSSPTMRGWRQSLEVFLTEFDSGPGLTTHPVLARQLEGLMIDGLLLGQPHNYTDALLSGPHHVSSGPIAKARSLLEETPEDDWSNTSLARAVHVSVRSLHAGFAREVGTPPMTYLRMVRLRRARDVLRRARPGTATVASVAAGLGFGHPGRFAAAYHDLFGELPMTTLHRR